MDCYDDIKISIYEKKQPIAAFIIRKFEFRY